jgi:hypothetical protein
MTKVEILEKTTNIMNTTDEIEEILSNNWKDVYSICESVQDCIDYIYCNTDDDTILEDNWDIFTDMVDDAFHGGFITLEGIEFEPMEE